MRERQWDVEPSLSAPDLPRRTERLDLVQTPDPSASAVVAEPVDRDDLHRIGSLQRLDDGRSATARLPELIGARQDGRVRPRGFSSFDLVFDGFVGRVAEELGE
jgi:hypothetical protein